MHSLKPEVINGHIKELEQRHEIGPELQQTAAEHEDRGKQCDFKDVVSVPDRGFAQHPCDQADGFYESEIPGPRDFVDVPPELLPEACERLAHMLLAGDAPSA